MFAAKLHLSLSILDIIHAPQTLSTESPVGDKYDCTTDGVAALCLKSVMAVIASHRTIQP